MLHEWRDLNRRPSPIRAFATEAKKLRCARSKGRRREKRPPQSTRSTLTTTDEAQLKPQLRIRLLRPAPAA
jgi:hypothetical protein